MARAKDVQSYIAGNEPDVLFVNANSTVPTIKENYKINLILALNWYSANKSPNDAQKYLVATAIATKQKKAYIRKLEALPQNEVPLALCWCMRLLHRGAVFSDKDLASLDLRMKTLFARFDAELEIEKDLKGIAEDKVATAVKTVRDHMQVKIQSFLGDLEGLFDDWINDSETLSDEDAFYNYLRGKEIPQAYMKDVIAWCDLKIKEFGSVMLTKDQDLKDGYSNFTKKQFNLMIKFFQKLKEESEKYAHFKKVNRAPRKRKAKPASVQVAKLQYLKESKEYKLNSVSPIDIIGSEQLWVFNVKTRMLTVFRASGSLGLAVRGSTLLNFDIEASETKKLRKPEKQLDEVKNGGKVALRRIMENIKCKSKSPKGRINKDTILIRIV
jgi:hypothetical protein